MWWFYLSVIVILVFKVYFRYVYNYWKSRGVPTPDYSYVFGNLGSSLLLKQSTGELHTEIYQKFEGHNYVGFYKFMQPSILIRNPEILKDIMLKNFNSFHDNDVYADEKVDLMFGKNPFALKGERWKVTRGQITPCFSSSKMKAMMPLLVENARKMVNYLETAAKEGSLEAKELCSKFTCENVASCAFGLEGRCFVDPNAEFREKGRKLLQPSYMNGLKILLIRALPSLSMRLKVKFTSDELTDFFRNLVKDTIDYRRANKIRRDDFLDSMHDLMNKINDEKEFNYDDITAHAGGFFLDGFETSAVAISFALYEIAANLEVQQRLRTEIDDIVKKHDDEFTYEAIQDMAYLDCVLKESLRKNSPALSVSRSCTVPYELPPIFEDGSGPTPVLTPGQQVVIPISGLHMDEKFFPDPEIFDPDRFAENGKKIVKGTYLPFGDGPRICLGNKFGVLQSKIGIAAIVANYELSVDSRTQEPIEMDSKHFLRAAVGGLWLKFSKRTLKK